MRNKAVPAMLSALALAGIMAGSAIAAESPATDTARADAPSVSAAVDAALPCFTSFSPSAPQGGPMDHRYKNCNAFTIRVTTGYQSTTGQITAFENFARTLPPQGEVVWHYDATLRNVNYHTIIFQ